MRKSNQLFFLILIILVLYNFTVADSLSEYYNLTKHKDKISFKEYDIWLSAIFVAPVIEELLFRLPLSEKEGLNWMLIFPFLVFSSVSFFTFQYFLIIPVLLFLYTIYRLVIKGNSFSEFYLNNKKYIIVFVSFTFCFMHIILYSNESILFHQKLLLVLVSYLPVSIALAYFRIKSGILTAILLHSFFNLSSVLLNSLIY